MNQRVIRMYRSNYTRPMFNSTSLIVLASRDEIDKPINTSCIINEDRMILGLFPREIVLDGKILTEPNLKVYHVLNDPTGSITDRVNVILTYDVIEPEPVVSVEEPASLIVEDSADVLISGGYYHK